MNLLATGVLLLYMQTLGYLADLARTATSDGMLQTPSPVVHAGGATVLLIVALVLSVYKPRGLTPWGQTRTVNSNDPEHSPARRAGITLD